MNILCIFAGQGYKNKALFNFLQNNEHAQNFLKSLTSTMDIDLENNSIDDPNYSQLLIGAYQLTLFNLLKPFFSAHQVTLAGYSLGEVNAFLASTDANPEEINATLHFRTQLMTSILQEGSDYDLLFIRGQYQLQEVQELCKQHHCGIAIINSDERLILGGKTKDLNDLLQQLKPSHSQFLNIHLPSHTFFYQDKKGLLQAHLQSLFFKPLLYPILSPLELCKIYDLEQEAQLLDKELYTTLQWSNLCNLIPEYHYDLILDLGPGDAMTRQLKTMNLDLTVITFANYNNIAGALNALQNFK